MKVNLKKPGQAEGAPNPEMEKVAGGMMTMLVGEPTVLGIRNRDGSLAASVTLDALELDRLTTGWLRYKAMNAKGKVVEQIIVKGETEDIEPEETYDSERHP